MSKAFLEAIKEPLRLLVLAAVSWILVTGVDVVFGVDVKSYWYFIITTVLRFVDKYLHESDTKNPLSDVNGLVPF